MYSDKVKRNLEKISHYKKYVDTLNYDGIEFPVSIKQITKIEDQNNISFNVFAHENKNCFSLYVFQKVTETTLDFLSILEEENQHYVWIKDFNRFMFNQNKHKHRLHFCKYCLQCFTSEEILNNQFLTNFLLVEIDYTKIVALNVRCCGCSTGERRMLNLSNILEDLPLGGSTSLTANVPEVLFIAEPLMDIRSTLPGDMSVKAITLLL